MDTTPTPDGSDSPFLRGRRSIAALFKSDDAAKSAVKALTDDGFISDEIDEREQDGGYLVSVYNPVHVARAAAILEQQGGDRLEGDSAAHDAERAAASADENGDDTGAPSIPVDSGLSEPGSKHRVGGGVFTRGSSSGGSGSGTATGGSLFGSSR